MLDADALNILAIHEDLREKIIQYGGRVVLTPHLGEASRLLKKPVAEIAQDPISAVQELTSRFNACVVLKDAMTLVGSPDGRLYFNQTGNHGMATAGSGDVLAGVIGGLIAEGMPPFDAAYLGVYLHGAAGDQAAHQNGYYGLTATDIIGGLQLEKLAGIQI